MKCFGNLTMILLLIIFLTTIAFADGRSFTIDQLHMQIQIPNDYRVIMPDRSLEDDEVAISIGLGLNIKETKEMLTGQNAYLNAMNWSGDNMAEIIVTMITDSGSQSLHDFNKIDDDKFNDLCKALAPEMMNKLPATLISSCIYRNAQASYCVFEYKREGPYSEVYTQQYYTVKNGQAINITYNSYGIALSQRKIDELKFVVDDIIFDETKASIIRPGTLLRNVIIKAVIGGIFGLVSGAVAVIIGKSKKKSASNDAKHTDEPSTPVQNVNPATVVSSEPPDSDATASQSQSSPGKEPFKVKVKKVSVAEETHTKAPVKSKPQKRRIIPVIILCVLLLASVSANAYQYFYREKQLNSKLEASQEETANKFKVLNEYINENQKLKDKCLSYGIETNQLKSDFSWYKTHIALTTSPNGNCAYHTIGCSYLGDYFYVYTVENAEDRGCWPCSKCHNSNIDFEADLAYARMLDGINGK